MGTWTLIDLSVNGVDQTMEALGVTKATLSLSNQSEDVLRLEFDLPADAAPVWPYGHHVGLHYTDDEGVRKRYFAGTARPVSREGADSAESHTIEVVGPWWDLTRTPVGLGVQYLFVDTTGDQPVRQSAAVTLERLLSAACTAGCFMAPGSVVVADVWPYEEPMITRSYGDAIRSVMRFFMDSTLWFDYSGEGFPIANVTMRLASATLTYTMGQPPLAEMELSNRVDLKPTGVTVLYQTDSSDDTNPDTMSPTVVYTDTAGAANPQVPSPGQLLITIGLQPNEEAPYGVAGRWYEMLTQASMWEGTIKLMEREAVNGTQVISGLTEIMAVRPGVTVNILGTADPAYATMYAHIQNVERNLVSGETLIRVGWPGFMGVQDLFDLLRHDQLARNKDVVAAPQPPGAPITNGGKAPVSPPNLPGPSGPFSGYLWYGIAGDIAAIRFSVAPGVVGSGAAGSGDTTPTWGLDGTSLDTSPPPSTLVQPGTSLDYWLYIEYKPDVNQFQGVDNTGAEQVEYRALSTGTFVHCAVVTVQAGTTPSDPAAQAAQIDPTGGTVQKNARMYFKLGTVVWIPGQPAPQILTTRSGSMNVIYLPPNRMMIVSS